MSTCKSDDSNLIIDVCGSKVQQFCTYCQNEISSFQCQPNTVYSSMIIYVCCGICEEFYLCLMCFSSGAEIGPHKNYHDYKLITFFKASSFSIKLLNALEEWTDYSTEKLIGTKNIVLSWKDVANLVGSDNPEEVKREYYNNFVDGYLGQYVIELVNKHISYPQVVSLDQAIKMGCLDNCSTYFPTCKYLKVPKNTENVDEYEVQVDDNRSYQTNNQDFTLQNENTLDSYQVQLLLQCVGELGYGNWESICQLYNKNIHMEYPKGKHLYLSETRIKEEYLLRFIQNPILRGTWIPFSSSSALIPDRTKRLEGPRSDYEDILKERLPIDDLDIFIDPPEFDNEDEDVIVDEQEIEQEQSDDKKRCIVCIYCQEEFKVIGYRSDNQKLSNYKLITVYTCCTNKQTCEDLYLCLMCFSSGAEIGKHKNNHSYKLITEVKTFSCEKYLNKSSWNAIEHLALLYALEEWLCETSDKYIDPLNSQNVITDWDSVAQHIRSKNAVEAKTEFQNLMLCPRIKNILELYTYIEPLVTYENAVEMGCFGNFNKTTSIITKTGEKLIINEKNTWTKSELELLLEYTNIYGYGNWNKISSEFNKAIAFENVGKKKYFIKRNPGEIKRECLLRFYVDPIRRGIWKSPINNRPIILDRTRIFKQPVNMKYPVVNYNLFALISYNYVTDEFEYPYKDTAEYSLDSVDDFETNIENYYSKLSSEGAKHYGATKVTELDDHLHIKRDFNLNEEKTIISLEQYNSILCNRQRAKICVHNYRLIEQFAMYKDKELPKIKPFSEQTFGERLVKMSRFMTVDVHRSLIEGTKNEKLLLRRLNELKFYKTIGLTKLSEIDMFNSLQNQRHQKTLSTLLYTDPTSQTFNDNLIPSKTDGKCIMKYIKFICSKLSKSHVNKNMCRFKYLSNNKCEELLTNTEKMLCLKYKIDSNYYLKTKCEILNHGLQEDSSKTDCLIYKYLVNINKVKVQPPIFKL